MLHRSKLKWIGKYVAGKSVLDLGCVCHELDVSDPPWLHGYLAERAGSLLGVDVLDEQLEEMRSRGFDVVCADVETMDLGRRFDVIVAGDIVEHLSNPGALLARSAEHLAEGGVLLITTPNPVTPIRLLRVLTGGRVPAHSQHTCWFSAKVLAQLAGRYGFEVMDESYSDDARYYYRLWPRISARGGPARRAWRRTRVLIKRLLWRPWVWLNSLLCLVRPAFAETLCLALRPAPLKPSDTDVVCETRKQDE